MQQRQRGMDAVHKAFLSPLRVDGYITLKLAHLVVYPRLDFLT
jgi:hypothetical protein